MPAPLSPAITARVAQLMNMGFKNFDAFHLACAESAEANVFSTCDDRFLRCARRNQSALRVRIASFLELAEELFL